jgi:hypothetical protein
LKSLDREHPCSDVSCHIAGTTHRIPAGGQLPLPRTRRWRARFTRFAKTQVRRTCLESDSTNAETSVVVPHFAHPSVDETRFDCPCATGLHSKRSHPLREPSSTTVRVNEPVALHPLHPLSPCLSTRGLDERHAAADACSPHYLVFNDEYPCLVCLPSVVSHFG